MATEYSQIESSPYINRSWLSGVEKDADYELTEQSTLHDLRRISSRLIKQNFFASGLQQAYVNNIMGGDIVVNVIGRPDIDLLLKKELSSVDLDQMLSLSAMMSRVVSAAFEKGDVAITMPTNADGAYVGLVEASRIRTPNDLKNETNIRNGVKYVKGRMDGFYYRSLAVNLNDVKKVFNDTSANYQYQPFFNKNGERVASLFRSPINIRPDQTRQIPVLTPLFNLLRYVDSLLEYTLVGTMVAAAFSVFIRSKNPDGTREALGKQNKTGLNQIGQISPGSIWFLNGASESIEFASPNKPSDNTDQILRRLTRFMAMTLRIPYEDAFLDLSESSYAAFKSGQLVANRMKRRWDDAIYPNVEWIVRRLLKELWAKGQINIDPISLDLDIILPKLGVVDDEKASRANRLDILYTGVKSRRLACSEAGIDYDAIQDQLTQEELLQVERQAQVLVKQKELEEKYGIDFTPENTPTETFDAESEANRDNRKADGNW